MAIEIKERYTTAVISTAHISKDDAVLLTEASYNPRSEVVVTGFTQMNMVTLFG
ncbi:hypothetical protein [Klebsiella pneumoniae]|uniref:hypothetical protein n=1 Tax=Klebsiella pneumoniae TaxID=573 RepID=UPI001D0E6273|nr:hypothetical protein [Klebsiella pneumoniae]